MTEISLQFIAGRLQGILDHLTRQDETRDAMHRENRERFEAMDIKLNVAANDHLWIEETGRPMDARVRKLENAALVTKGKVAALAAICTACGAIIMAIGKSGLQWLGAHMP